MKVKIYDDKISITENYKSKIPGTEYDETESKIKNGKDESLQILVKYTICLSFGVEDGIKDEILYVPCPISNK